MMRAFTACLLITLAPFGAGAMTNYEACIALVKSNPERAQNEALAWYQASGDLGALHCEALALAAQGASRTAAEKLEALAAAPEIDADTSAEIRMQAALLYRQGGDDKSAETVLTPALSESRGAIVAPGFIERASIRAAGGDWQGVRADLDAALRLLPGDGEALALRAAARRRLNDLPGAAADAKAATAAEPENPAAWLERGLAERDLVETIAARASFLRTIELAPEAPTAAMARAALQDMDAPAGAVSAAAPTETTTSEPEPAQPKRQRTGR